MHLYIVCKHRLLNLPFEKLKFVLYHWCFLLCLLYFCDHLPFQTEYQCQVFGKQSPLYTVGLQGSNRIYEALLMHKMLISTFFPSATRTASFLLECKIRQVHRTAALGLPVLLVTRAVNEVLEYIV